MPHPAPAPPPQPGWALLFFGSPPDLDLLGGTPHVMVRLAGHFFLQAPEMFKSLPSPEEVAWAGTAILQERNAAARLRYGVRLEVHSGAAVWTDRDGRWDLDAVARAIDEIRGREGEPLAAKNLVRRVVEQLVLRRLAETRS